MGTCVLFGTLLIDVNEISWLVYVVSTWGVCLFDSSVGY